MKPLSYPDFVLRRGKIAVVLTRDIIVGSGRTAVIAKMLESLSRAHDLSRFRLRNLVEVRSPVDLGVAAMAWLISLVHGRPLPLQCLLYSSRAECRRIAEQIRAGAFDAVYLDTVRCQMLQRELRRVAPGIFVVTDFDDLMSRRMKFLAENNLPLLTGHAGTSFPAWLRRLTEGPLARLVTVFDAATLHHTEKEAAEVSNVVVLTSVRECEILRKSLRADAQARLVGVPPPMDLRAEPWTNAQPFRFVFIGSDRLLQNRAAIDHLLERWRILKPATQLHIYSAQTRPNQNVDGVHWHGFVENLAEVYRPGSVLLLPSLVSGGIKTKVAEAWSFGCPVLGNTAAFEGLEVSDYPLELMESLWDPLLLDPQFHMKHFIEAAKLGHEFVATHLSAQQFHRTWSEIVASAFTSAESTMETTTLEIPPLLVSD